MLEERGRQGTRQVIAPFRPIETRIRESPRPLDGGELKPDRIEPSLFGGFERELAVVRRDEQAAARETIEQSDPERSSEVAVAASRIAQHRDRGVGPLALVSGALGEEGQALEGMRDLRVREPEIAVPSALLAHDQPGVEALSEVATGRGRRIVARRLPGRFGADRSIRARLRSPAR